MKFGELIMKFRHPTIDYNSLQDELTSGLETTKFIQKLISDVRRVDGIYEILYVAYNAVAQEQDGMHLSTEKRNALVNEMHQLFEFAVLNLVAIEKIMKKHDKINSTSKQGPFIRSYVEHQTFLYTHLVESPLYQRLPQLYAAATFENQDTHFCNVCVSEVPYAMQLECSHVLCLGCASQMREHFFTECPTCRTKCNLSPVYAKAKELLGETPNPNFMLLQLEALVQPASPGGDACGVASCGDGLPSLHQKQREVDMQLQQMAIPLDDFQEFFGTFNQQPETDAVVGVVDGGGASGALRGAAVGGEADALSVRPPNLLPRSSGAVLDEFGASTGEGAAGGAGAGITSSAFAQSTSNLWLELGISHNEDKSMTTAHPVGSRSSLLESSAGTVADNGAGAAGRGGGGEGGGGSRSHSGSPAPSSSSRGGGGANITVRKPRSNPPSPKGRRRPSKAPTTDEDDEIGFDHLEAEGDGYMDGGDPFGLTGRLAQIITRQTLRCGPNEWRAVRAKLSDITAEEDQMIHELRRKAMSCVYAERSRKKRLGKLKDVTGRVGELDQRNRSLEAENLSLRRQLADVKAELSRANSGGSFYRR